MRWAGNGTWSSSRACRKGVWPDLRLRSSLLGAQELADLVDRGIEPGRSSSRATDDALRRAVLDDELRLFLVAVSRARRHLVVTAVRSQETLPSPFIDLADPPGQRAPRRRDGELRPLTVVPRPMTLPALVAELRAVLLESAPPRRCGAGGTASAPTRRQQAARALARLARAGVPGADPDDWYGLAPLSGAGRLRDAGEVVRVSPSKVETFEQCPLRWVLQASGGSGPSGVVDQPGVDDPRARRGGAGR